MSLFGSNGESGFIDWTSDPSHNEQWSLGPSQSSTSTSSSVPDEELRTILTMGQVPELTSLGSPEPLVRDRDEHWAPLEPMQAQTQTTPRRLMSDASWDAVRQRRTEQRYTPLSSSSAQAGSSSGPWRPWDDRPATTQSVPSPSGPSSSNNNNAPPSLYVPPDHKTVLLQSSEPPSKSRILELLNSMNQPFSTSPSKGNDKEGAQEEVEDPTALSTFTCPVCFCPPENATLTPCGHVTCGKCLFSAIRAARQRHAGLYGREGLAPDGTRNEAVCPVCRAPIPGWDGRGGGVIGLSTMIEEG